MAWICHDFPLTGRFCMGSRCKMRIFPERGCRTASSLSPLMPSRRSPQARADSTGPLPLGGEKCGCGQRLATGGWDNTVKLWDIESGTLLWTSWQTNSVRHLAFGPDGCLLAGGGGDATIRIWDATSGTLHQTPT